MKPTTVAFLAAAGMLLTSLTVYSVTPPGGFHGGPPTEVADAIGGESPLAVATDDRDRDRDRDRGDAISRFDVGSTLRVEGRLGHARLARAGRGETFVLLEIRGSDTGGVSAPAPVNLSIVVDRSGSMKGARLRNAIAGAAGAVDRLHEGDVVSVVTFDTTTQVVVPPTPLDPASRDRVIGAIRGMPGQEQLGFLEQFYEMPTGLAGAANPDVVTRQARCAAEKLEILGWTGLGPPCAEALVQSGQDRLETADAVGGRALAAVAADFPQGVERPRNLKQGLGNRGDPPGRGDFLAAQAPAVGGVGGKEGELAREHVGRHRLCDEEPMGSEDQIAEAAS